MGRGHGRGRGRGPGRGNHERGGGGRGGRWRGNGRGCGRGRGGSWHPNPNLNDEPNLEARGDGNFRPRWNRRRGGRRGGRRNRRPRFNPRNQILYPIIDYEALKEARKCVECGKEDASYRCPACLKKYCSLVCYKVHKAGSNCTPVKKEDPAEADKTEEDQMELEDGHGNSLSAGGRRKGTEPKKYLFPTKDTVLPEGLAKLQQEPLVSQLTDMFKSEALREKIRTLDQAEKPKDVFRPYLQDEEFSAFNNTLVDALSDELFQMAVRARRF